ncbi:MAG TPA: YlxR family protein [Anaerolineae bacterium]|nr:YlxR family protein [Anaerolineae bacterium]HQH37656.1 YlxR family protein [Anaerolineae bacterium]
MKKKRQPRQKHVPARTCVACRMQRAKRDLVRVVRLTEGGVVVDETGKQKGRGAYLCRQRACWTLALQRGALHHALRTTLTTEEMAVLQRYAAALPETLEMDARAIPGAENLIEEV